MPEPVLPVLQATTCQVLPVLVLALVLPEPGKPGRPAGRLMRGPESMMVIFAPGAIAWTISASSTYSSPARERSPVYPSARLSVRSTLGRW
jgi:hypothetical protein